MVGVVGTGSGGSHHRNWATAQKHPRIRLSDRKRSAARGAGNPRRRAAARGGGRGKGGGRAGPTWSDHVHRWVTAGQWGQRIRGGVEEGPDLGNNQEAYDAECIALAQVLEEASRRNTTPQRVTIFTDAQAVVRRMASDDPGPGQQYALQARKRVAMLCRARPGIVIEIRWCPAHKGVAGNEKADEWAKTAAE